MHPFAWVVKVIVARYAACLIRMVAARSLHEEEFIGAGNVHHVYRNQHAKAMQTVAAYVLHNQEVCWLI